ncbi:hypothetical protein [Priestia endophytica]|uniref:hypothetical protein n=1 Tax=Priestia endophytica TaxID=135735 RepID=UPI002282F2CE|nr:hypothetical protein [Priestia endophytica]MCY8234818.1 hypothetical protein [Priestia endophytica]
MIEVKKVDNGHLMEGVALQESAEKITIGTGTLDNQKIEESSFNLVFDDEVEALHDLYIVIADGKYKYHLDVTYLDGINMPYYNGTDFLFHRFMSIKTSSNDSYTGDVVYIVELEKEAQNDGRDTTEPNTQEAND